jgi:magnesium transporter
VLSLVLAALGGVIAGLWQGHAALGLTVGLTLLVTVLFGTITGIMLPFAFRYFKGELRYTQARFSSLLIGVATIAIYMAIAAALLAAT